MIRPMQPADVPKIAALEQLCFADPWSEASVESELHNPLSLWLVDEEDGVLAGYVGSQSVPPETDMMNFAVAPAFRARGIGRALLCTLQALLHKRGITSLSLEVRVSNAPARALYDSLGYVEVGRRPKYYVNPIEDALILRKELRDADFSN